MEFKVGDTILVTAPTWCEKCVIISMGYGDKILYVRKAKGEVHAIYKSWVFITSVTKNTQLLFEFMT